MNRNDYDGPLPRWDEPAIQVVKANGLGERQERLQKELAVLGQELDALRSRLSPVLAEEEAEKSPPMPPEPEEVSALAQFLNQATQSVRRLAYEVSALGRRVDL